MFDESLEDAIFALPQEEKLRLEYAAWLEERNDPLADLIQVQCERYKLPIDSEQCHQLEHKENELIDKHRGIWLGPEELAGRFSFSWDRGFLRAVHRTGRNREECKGLEQASLLRSLGLGGERRLVQWNTIPSDPRSQEAGYESYTPKELRRVGRLTQLRILGVGRSCLNDLDLAELLPLRNLVSLNMSDTLITSAATEMLIKLTKLRKLYLRQNEIDDVSLASLGQLAQLEELDLYGTRVCGSGLVELARLARLRNLNLSRTLLSDENCIHLESLSILVELDVGDTSLTDASIPHLLNLKHLQRIFLEGTNISDDGRQRLVDRGVEVEEI